MLHRSLFVASFVFALTVIATAVQAAEATPEVDPSSMSAAVALLAAGGTFVADRIRRKLFAR